MSWHITSLKGKMCVPLTLPENFGVFLPGSSSRHSLKYWQHWRCPANTSWKLWYISSWKFVPAPSWQLLSMAHSQLEQRLFLTVCTSTMTKNTLSSGQNLWIVHIFCLFEDPTLKHFSSEYQQSSLIHFLLGDWNYWKGCIEWFIVGYLFVCYQLLVFKFLIISFFEIEMIGRDAFDVLVIGRCTHQTWYCRNSNRICSCQSILSLDPKTSDDEKGSDPELMKGNRN